MRKFIIAALLLAGCKGAQYQVKELPKGSKVTTITTVKYYQKDSTGKYLMQFQHTDSVTLVSD